MSQIGVMLLVQENKKAKQLCQSDVIYPEIRYEQDSINHLEESEILVTVEDEDRQVVVHVQHLGRFFYGYE